MTDEANEVRIVEYNPEWPRMFEEEKTRLLAAAGQWIEETNAIRWQSKRCGR